MSSIGIFGDSFADPNHGHDEFPDMKYNGWMYHLKNYVPEIHARGGTSVYSSFKNFLKHHEKYDRVIFLITQPQRIFFTNIIYNDDEMPAPSYENATWALKNIHNLNTRQILTLKAIQDYYLYVNHYETQLDISQCLVDKLISLRPDGLFINIFYEAMGPRKGLGIFENVLGAPILKYLDTTISSLADTSKVDFPHQLVSQRFEKRMTCHLSNEANKLLGDHIMQALEKNKWAPEVPSFLKHEVTDLNYYFHDRYVTKEI